MNPKLTPSLPWYRNRWPWLLMLGPFAVIVAAMITLWLALRSNDGLVADDYYKQGLAVNQVTSRDRQAAESRVSAEVALDVDRRLIRVALHRGRLADMPAVLLLKLSHPTRSGFDHSFRLQRDDSGNYSAAFTEDLSGRWYVSLEDEGRVWRLASAWDTAKLAVLVLPDANPGP